MAATRPVPQWPALYNPGLEILNITNNSPEQPGGYYLERTEGTSLIERGALQTNVEMFCRCLQVYILLDDHLLHTSFLAMWNLRLPKLHLPSIFYQRKTTKGLGGS